MSGLKTEKTRIWSAEEKQEAVKRIVAFISESDEEYFHRIIQDLSDQEVEEYLQECPEFRKYWKKQVQ